MIIILSIKSEVNDARSKARTLPALATVTGCAALAISQPLSAQAKRPVLSYQQKQALVLAYRAGDHYGIGMIFAAVVLQESQLCKIAATSSAGAMGCSQVKSGTAKEVTGASVPNWQLESPVLQDENMAIGARYLELCLRRFGYPEGIGCYYTGTAGAEKLGRKGLVKFWYTKAVLANMKLLKKLPQSGD